MQYGSANDNVTLSVEYQEWQYFHKYEINWMQQVPDWLEDHVTLTPYHWYGGAEVGTRSISSRDNSLNTQVLNQNWPLEQQNIKLAPYVTGNVFANQYGGIMEKYWFHSGKVAILSPFDSTLWFSVNENNDG